MYTRPLYLHITDNILAKKSSIYRENIAFLSNNTHTSKLLIIFHIRNLFVYLNFVFCL